MHNMQIEGLILFGLWAGMHLVSIYIYLRNKY